MPLPNPFAFWRDRADGHANDIQETQVEADEADFSVDDQLAREQLLHHQRQQQQQQQQISIDKHLWRQYLTRINPGIIPTDAAFQAQLHAFHAALKQGAIESVLKEHFAEYDVWRFVGGRLCPKRYPEARAQQDRDTAAYKVLMTSSAEWRDAKARDTLAFKYTMMYFGLPVQPMLFKDAFAKDLERGRRGGFGLLGHADDGEEDEGDGHGEQVYFVPEQMRPLRFLNYYEERGHGKDHSHMNPDKTYELFYTLPMTLRGGDGDLDSSMAKAEDDDDDDDGDQEPVMRDAGNLSLRGGEAIGEGVVKLWGLSGRTVARFSHGLGSFFYAVDRLLGLRSRHGAAITVSILGHPTNQTVPCAVLWDGQCLLGNRRRETDFLRRMGLALRGIMDHYDANNKNNEQEWEIYVSQISNDQRFKDGGTEDLSYTPCLQSHQLASFSLEGALAYLFIPDNVNAGTAANHYQKWFQSLWHTLYRPHPDSEEAYELGSSIVPPPESCLVRLRFGSTPDTSTDYFLSDTGPPRQVWEWLVEACHLRGQREFTVDTRPLPDQGSLVHIPGYFRGVEEKVAYRHGHGVIRIAMQSIPAPDRPALQFLRIRPFRSGEFVDGEEAACVFFRRNDCDDDDSGLYDMADSDETCQEKVQRWVDHGYILHVQPRWRSYEAKMLASPVSAASGEDLTWTWNGFESWTDVLAQVKAVCTQAGLPLQDTIIRIDQRLRSADTGQQQNRTCWDFEAVDTLENTKMWDDFLNQFLTTKQMTVQLLSRRDLSNAAPFALRNQQPDKFYWGCHDREGDVIALHEAVEEEEEAASEHHQQHRHHHHHHQQQQQQQQQQHDEDEDEGATPSQHVPESDVLYQRRTTGWGNPKMQAQGPNDLDLAPERLPARGEGMDDFERGKIFREWSYGHPLSIHMEGQLPEIPINAPPLEQMLKVPGPNGVSDSVPVLSTQLMTATEQRRLQEAFFQMRSLALHRVQKCPFPACRKYFSVDDQGTEAFQRHLKNAHIGKQCPLCHDTVVLDCWAPWQVAQHFLDKHVHYFSHKGDLRRDLAVFIHSKGLVHNREEQFNFCPRCGRNHQKLDVKADRAHHDNLCFPGNGSDAVTTKFCISCGQGYTPVSGLNPDEAHKKECKATSEQREETAHCYDCGLPTHEFSRPYSHKHAYFCKGVERNRTNWCPWCGVDLKLTSQVECHVHLDACAQKPRTGVNPINTSTGEPMDSPRDTAEIRRRAQHFKPMSQQFVRIEVPKICPIGPCHEDLSLLNGGGLFKHLYGQHAEATNGMQSCPICRLDFQARGWAHLDEKIRHLNDHVERREQRILGDIQVARAKDRGDPTLREGLEKHNGDNIDPVQQMAAAEEQLAHARDTIIDIQREKRELQRKLANPSEPETGQTQSAELLASRHATVTRPIKPAPAAPGVSGDDGEAGPSSRGAPQAGNRPRRPARDGSYRPSRRGSAAGEDDDDDDDDDDYREGEVPEPRPDLGSDSSSSSSSSSPPRRKRTQDTPTAESAWSAAKKARTEDEALEETATETPGRRRRGGGRRDKGKAVAGPRRSSPRIARNRA